MDKTGFKNGMKIHSDGKVTYITNLNVFKKIIEETFIPLREQGKLIDKNFEEAFNIMETYTGKKIKSFEVLVEEIQKIKQYKDFDNVTIGELFNDIKNLPPMIREALKNYPISGHLIDAKLNTTKGDVDIVPRIELSPFENRVVNSLIKSLYENSNRNKKSEAYYLGNGEVKMTKDGEPISQLIIKPQQLYKEITGKERPNGKDTKEIREALIKLSNKDYLIEYRKKVGKDFIVIRRNQPLLNFSSLARFNEEEASQYTNGDESLFTKKEAFVISFNPIFNDQIKKKYILFPTDLQEKLSLASPKKLKASTNNLVDYLLRALSSKNYSQQIYKKKLEEVLNISHERKARREAKTEEALNVCQKVKLLESYSKEQTSKGEKYILKINSQFIK